VRSLLEQYAAASRYVMDLEIARQRYERTIAAARGYCAELGRPALDLRKPDFVAARRPGEEIAVGGLRKPGHLSVQVDESQSAGVGEGTRIALRRNTTAADRAPGLRRCRPLIENLSDGEFETVSTVDGTHDGKRLTVRGPVRFPDVLEKISWSPALESR